MNESDDLLTGGVAGSLINKAGSKLDKKVFGDDDKGRDDDRNRRRRRQQQTAPVGLLGTPPLTGGI